MSAAENNVAEVLVEHAEYKAHFENTEILDGREYEAGATFNPFLHVSTHRMIEDQLKANSPVETALFCEEIEEKGFSHHDAVHFAIMILLHVMYVSASGNRPFDTARYKRLLIQCKAVDPAEMEKVIETDFSRNPYRHEMH